MVLGGLLWVLWGNYGTKWHSSAVSVSLLAEAVLPLTCRSHGATCTAFLPAVPL